MLGGIPPLGWPRESSGGGARKSTGYRREVEFGGTQVVGIACGVCPKRDTPPGRPRKYSGEAGKQP